MAAVPRQRTTSESALDKYTIDESNVLGMGSYSVVYRGERKADNVAVAVKRIQLYELVDEDQAEVTREVELLRQLEHPNIVKYLDSVKASSALYIVMEHAVGDLTGILEKARQRGSPLHEKTIWNLFYQIVSGVKHMHDNRILHRDIKPANIFVFADKKMKIGDLGLGRGFSPNTASTASYLGSPYYMSIERLKSAPYDFSSDIWSLGCVLYEMVALQSPYFDKDFESAEQLLARILRGPYPPLPDNYSETLRALVDRMLSIKPASRPTAEELVTAIKARQTADRAAAATP